MEGKQFQMKFIVDDGRFIIRWSTLSSTIKRVILRWDGQCWEETAVQPDVGAFHYPVLGLAFRSKRDKEGQWINCFNIIYWNFKVYTLILDTVSLRASSWCAEDSAYRRIFVNTIFFSLSCFFFQILNHFRNGNQSINFIRHIRLVLMMWMVTSEHRRRWNWPSASIPMNRTRRIFRIGSVALAWTSLGPFGASWKWFGKCVAMISFSSTEKAKVSKILEAGKRLSSSL